MSVPDDVATEPALPLRARPPQVLLGVGAALLVTAGAMVAAATGGALASVGLLALAGAGVVFSLGAASRGLRSSEETFATCAALLALIASQLGGPFLDGSPLSAAVLTAVFLGLHLLTPRTVVWPLASWGAAQLCVLRAVHLVPAVLHTELYLSVALTGLGIALAAPALIGRVAVVTTAPWWLVGVVGGSSSAWIAGGAEQWLSAALMLAAAFGLLVARLRAPLDPLLGPPRAVPVVAGLVAGAATAGAWSSLGTTALTLTGYAGVLVATIATGYLTGWHRGLFLPVALAGGITITVLCVGQLVAAERWSALSLLLLLTALPTVLVALRHPEDRPVAVPTTVGCLAGAVLLALPDGRLRPVLAAALLTALYAAAMAVGSALVPAARHATAAAAGACAAADFLLLVAHGDGRVLAVHLTVLGLCTIGWAVQAARHPDAPSGSTGAWRAGALQWVLAAWIWAGAVGAGALEWYSLPAAAGLLLAAGPRLGHGTSWPVWGPGLLVAAVPTTVLAAAPDHGPRFVWLLAAAALAMLAGARTSVRAPLLVGAGTALALTIGLVVRQLPWPLGAALVVGSLLLAVGMLRERHPVAGFSARLADLR